MYLPSSTIFLSPPFGLLSFDLFPLFSVSVILTFLPFSFYVSFSLLKNVPGRRSSPVFVSFSFDFNYLSFFLCVFFAPSGTPFPLLLERREVYVCEGVKEREGWGKIKTDVLTRFWF